MNTLDETLLNVSEPDTFSKFIINCRIFRSACDSLHIPTSTARQPNRLSESYQIHHPSQKRDFVNSSVSTVTPQR